MMKRIVFGLAVTLLPLCASAWAQAEKSDAKTAAEPVVKQLEAFRRDDYDTAFTFASTEIQAQFDRQSFEVMVRRGYPEIARSTFAARRRTRRFRRLLAVTVLLVRQPEGGERLTRRRRRAQFETALLRRDLAPA